MVPQSSLSPSVYTFVAKPEQPAIQPLTGESVGNPAEFPVGGVSFALQTRQQPGRLLLQAVDVPAGAQYMMCELHALTPVSGCVCVCTLVDIGALICVCI